VIVKALKEKYSLNTDEEYTDKQYEDTRKELVKTALRPIYDPKYRDKILEIIKDNEQVIDAVSIDKLIFS
jgi:hypothetical protein